MQHAGVWCGRRLSKPCHHHGYSLLLSVECSNLKNQVTQLPRVCTTSGRGSCDSEALVKKAERVQ